MFSTLKYGNDLFKPNLLVGNLLFQQGLLLLLYLKFFTHCFLETNRVYIILVRKQKCIYNFLNNEIILKEKIFSLVVDSPKRTN